LTANSKCPFCSTRVFTTTCAKCGAAYQGGSWKEPAVLTLPLRSPTANIGRTMQISPNDQTDQTTG
jgi:hypothetical protein